LYGIPLLRYLALFTDVITVLGASVLLVLALALPRLSALLLRKPLTFLGRLSYSLYLYHVVVLLTAINLLYGLLNLWLILLLALLGTFAVAVGAYYGIEVPAITLGKYLSARSLLLPKGAASKARTRGSRTRV
jgi:peptidoglycan/LPS O-acetylase OafA/YrhL